LQEVDLDIDRVDRTLAEAEEELKTEISIESLEATLYAEEERLKEVQARQQENQMETSVRRERSESLELRLYDGSMVNARDLESLQHEAANVRSLLEQNEAMSLELSIQLEESQTRCAELHIELTEAKGRWEERRGELNRMVSSLVAERGDYEKQRELLAGQVDQAALRRYETLRKSKGGRAVAKVERDLCQVCRMSLPTQLRQRVKSGRQTVNCTSCGRMLFVE
jgi:predicted  nucleic acid-binding Zn-ribbon protein